MGPVTVDVLLGYLGSEYVHRRQLEGQVTQLEEEIVGLRTELERMKEANVERSVPD